MVAYAVYGNDNFDIDYIRWTDAGAMAPIPEPATMALLGLGTLALLRKRKA